MNIIISPILFIKFVILINSVIKLIDEVKDITLDIIMTFGPAINYIFQALKFYNTKSSIGFSNYICLVTMMAHTTKIFFWFGKRYIYTLLIQSILVIIIQLFIIYLSVKYKKKKETDSNSIIPEKKNFCCELFDCSKTFKIKLIWRWDKAIEFYKFYFIIIAIFTILLFICGIKNQIYANIVGYINLLMELLSCLPQIIELYRTKNQRNLSKLMVYLWLIGNLIKIYYNYHNFSPVQLILGAGVQVFFNLILIGQIIYYYRKNKNENLLEEINIKDNENYINEGEEFIEENFNAIFNCDDGDIEEDNKEINTKKEEKKISGIFEEEGENEIYEEMIHNIISNQITND